MIGYRWLYKNCFLLAEMTLTVLCHFVPKDSLAPGFLRLTYHLFTASFDTDFTGYKLTLKIVPLFCRASLKKDDFEDFTLLRSTCCALPTAVLHLLLRSTCCCAPPVAALHLLLRSTCCCAPPAIALLLPVHSSYFCTPLLRYSEISTK